MNALDNTKLPTGGLPPVRLPREIGARTELTAAEVDGLILAARRTGRHIDRDALMILMAYRHGFRAAELVALKWTQIDLGRNACVLVERVKHGDGSRQPLSADEMRLLRKLQRSTTGPFVFEGERGPLTTRAFHKIVQRAGELAGLGVVHPHMLRHSCGYQLANNGVDTRSIQAYLGHRNIMHTVRYTKMAATRFTGFDKLI
jgi:integrase